MADGVFSYVNRTSNLLSAAYGVGKMVAPFCFSGPVCGFGPTTSASFFSPEREKCCISNPR